MRLTSASGSRRRLVRCAAIVVCLFPCLRLAAAPAAAPGWRAGLAREAITPPAGLWMTGYAVRTHPAEGAAQELWVKALALADAEGNRGVLLTADLCTIAREHTDAVAAELHRRYGLPRSAVMTNVSHTHCSPALAGSLGPMRPIPPSDAAKTAAYTRELVGRMVAVAAAALDRLAPAEVGWSEDEAAFGINRRENAEKEVPTLRAAGKLRGPTEPRVPVLAVRDAQGALLGLLVSYACHNTTLSLYQWHGDYAGCAQAELERRHPGATVLFASGCGADINPNPRRELAHAEQHGRELADAADRALAKPLRPISGRFASAWADVPLTFSREPTDEEIRTAREKDQPNKEMHQAWADLVDARKQQLGAAARNYDYPVQTWALGSLTWVALGGEVVVDYALRLRRELGGDAWIFGYANDLMGYIPSERVLKEGRYEGATSMIPYGKPGPWSPGLEEKIVHQVHELAANVRAR